jgi:hypothetical protein
LNKQGDNLIVVIENGERSEPFNMRL